MSQEEKEKRGARCRAVIRRFGSVSAAARALGVPRGTLAQVAADADVREGTGYLFDTRLDALEQQKAAS